jgi:hypothetical protein
MILLQAASPMDRAAALVGVATCAGVLALGWTAVHLGRKSLRVTRRHRGVAATAAIVGGLSAAVSVAGACATLLRVAQSIA